MSSTRHIPRKLKFATLALLIAVPVVSLLMLRTARAGELNARSVTIGTPLASAVTTHDFNMTLVTPGVVGSIEFEYCTNSPFVGMPCTAPAGLDALGATLSTQTGVTGFTIDPSSSANRIVLTRLPAVTAAVPVRYLFSNITNPSTTTETVFVRISTFATDDATGVRTDEGTVAFSSARQIGAVGFVPPYLLFCVGVTVTADCTSVSGNYINFGNLGTGSASTATSQMSTSTNDVSGYVLTLAGTTMTSGINTIPALAIPTTSAPGTSQFGINLRANTAPLVGLDPVGVGTGVPGADYNNVDNFTFINGDIIASSPFSTEPNVLTVSYLINVADTQPPGIYATTLTYIATVQF